MSDPRKLSTAEIERLLEIEKAARKVLAGAWKTDLSFPTRRALNRLDRAIKAVPAEEPVEDV